MEISAAALAFLILAAAFGPLTHGSSGGGSLSQAHELGLEIPVGTRIVKRHSGVPRPTECCTTFTQAISCANMRGYYRTGRGCQRPGVIFINKWENKVCTNPQNRKVKFCMKKLGSPKK